MGARSDRAAPPGRRELDRDPGQLPDSRSASVDASGLEFIPACSDATRIRGDAFPNVRDSSSANGRTTQRLPLRIDASALTRRHRRSQRTSSFDRPGERNRRVQRRPRDERRGARDRPGRTVRRRPDDHRVPFSLNHTDVPAAPPPLNTSAVRRVAHRCVSGRTRPMRARRRNGVGTMTRSPKWTSGPACTASVP
jgi:hypothetical protein